MVFQTFDIIVRIDKNHLCRHYQSGIGGVWGLTLKNQLTNGTSKPIESLYQPEHFHDLFKTVDSIFINLPVWYMLQMCGYSSGQAEYCRHKEHSSIQDGWFNNKRNHT